MKYIKDEIELKKKIYIRLNENESILEAGGIDSSEFEKQDKRVVSVRICWLEN